jgi:hypothetical protein
VGFEGEYFTRILVERKSMKRQTQKKASVSAGFSISLADEVSTLVGANHITPMRFKTSLVLVVGSYTL